MLQVLIGNSGEKRCEKIKNAKGCFASDVVARNIRSRDEHWTGIGLDWIRTKTNFVGFGLDPDCDFLHKFRIRTGFGLG